MGKLRNLRPTLAPLPSRLGFAPGDEKAADRARNDLAPWRAWYRTARWLNLRQQVFLRDGYTCQRTGRLCMGKYPDPTSPVANHKRPHRGNPALFWDIDNIETVTKEVHDGLVQREERAMPDAAYGSSTMQWRPEWLRPSVIPATIVCGPPASGKSTYVANHAGPTDLIIDLDIIASRLSGQTLHGWDREQWLVPAIRARNEMLGDLGRTAAARWPQAWLILSEADAGHRQWWADHMRPARIVVIETPAAVCIARARQGRGTDADRTCRAITQWWAEYRRRRGDVIEQR